MVHSVPTRQRPAADPTAILPADARLLEALLRCHFLTIDQVQRLLYARGSRTHAAQRLLRLRRGGHVLAVPVWQPQTKGSAKYVYALTASGLAHLRDLGAPVPDAFRLHRPKQHSYLHYRHWVALSDLLVAALLLCRQLPTVELEALVHDRELTHAPIRIDVANGKRVQLVPDAFLSLVVTRPSGAAERVAVVVEVDRGTVQRPAWHERVRAYLRGIDAGGPLLAAFGVSVLSVVVLVPDRARLTQLAAWIGEAVAEAGREDLASFFLLTDADPAAHDPARFFFAPVFVSPLGGELAPVIEPPEEEALLAGKGAA